jgi:nitrogen fixation protein FixH
MDVDLVAEDYYAQEIDFQTRIDETANADSIKSLITVNVGDSKVTIAFPAATADHMINGTATFYRPSASSLDLTLPLELDDSAEMQVPIQLLQQGRYTLSLSWERMGTSYYLTKEVVI